MSLVLDALQRQARDEQPGGTDLTQEAAARRSTLAPWLGFLAVALLVNAGVLLWVGLLGDEGNGTAPPAAAPAAATGPLAAASPVLGAEPVVAAQSVVAAQPVIAAASVADAPLVAAAPLVEAAQPVVPTQPGVPAPTEAAAAYPSISPLSPMPNAQQQDAEAWTGVRTIERVALTELPPSARARLPGIVISSHVYADDPENRTIIANGVTLQEGSVLAGLPLKEIGPNGIVVEFESWLVEIPVFADW